MIKLARRIIKICLLVLWFVAIFIYLVILNLKKNPQKSICRLGGIWSRGLVRIFGIRIVIYGNPSDFQGCIIVSNHLGYLDIPVNASVFPTRFTPKTDIRKWPLLGWFIALSRPVWINRRSRQASAEAFRKIRDSVNEGINITVYPEGTSTDGKNGLVPFKSTVFQAASEEDVPIQPVLIKYIEEEGEPTPCWYGDMTLLPHLWRILGRKSIVAEIHILEAQSSRGRDRKTLAGDLHSVMDAEYRGLGSKMAGDHGEF